MKTHLQARSCPGFTLIEIITTIIILGILSAIVASFFKPAIDSYFSVANRAALSDKADASIRQLSREIQTALPNSLRTTGSKSTACIEFLPVVAGGRYRVQLDNQGKGDILDFATADTSFDVLAEERLSTVINSGGAYLAAIYNLGAPGADAYHGDVTAAIQTSTTTSSNLKLSAGKQFPFASPGNRFFVIANTSVVHSCQNGGIYRSTPAIAATAPQDCPGASVGTLLVDHVTSCSFSYTPAVDQRNGLVALSLQLTQNNETVSLYQEILVSNVP